MDRIDTPEPSVRLRPVRCQHCGAPLQVPALVTFVTCLHCGVRLRIESRDGQLFSSVLDAIHRSVRRVEAQSQQIAQSAEALQHESHRVRLRNAILHAEKQLAALDEQWEREQVRFSGWWRRVPRLGDIIRRFLQGAILTTAAVAIAHYSLDSDGGRAYAIGAGVIMGSLGMLAVVRTTQRYMAYSSVSYRYHRQRRAIQQRLADLRRAMVA